MKGLFKYIETMGRLYYFKAQYQLAMKLRWISWMTYIRGHQNHNSSENPRIVTDHLFVRRTTKNQKAIQVKSPVNITATNQYRRQQQWQTGGRWRRQNCDVQQNFQRWIYQVNIRVPSLLQNMYADHQRLMGAQSSLLAYDCFRQS